MITINFLMVRQLYVENMRSLAVNCRLATAAYSLEEGQNTESAFSSLKRNRSFNTGSLSSNASSLRKKFGMSTLGRENSKSEPESKVTSVWRTLSKTVKNKGESHLKSASLSKASLVRSRSRDRDSCMLPPLRPVSPERPSHDEHHARSGSPHLDLSLIDTSGERTPKAPGSLIKKKRRSSLSDLKAIHNFDTDSSQSPLKPPKSDHAQQLNAQARLLPQIPLPHKTALDHQPTKATEGYSPSPGRFGSPRNHGSLQRLQSPEKVMFSSRKENSPLAVRNTKLRTAQNPANDSSTLNPSSLQKQINSRTGISIPKPGLSERAIAPNSLTSPKKNCQPFQKLRMQSPQKASLTQQLI